MLTNPQQESPRLAPALPPREVLTIQDCFVEARAVIEALSALDGARSSFSYRQLPDTPYGRTEWTVNFGVTELRLVREENGTAHIRGEGGRNDVEVRLEQGSELLLRSISSSSYSTSSDDFEDGPQRNTRSLSLYSGSPVIEALKKLPATAWVHLGVAA